MTRKNRTTELLTVDRIMTFEPCYSREEISKWVGDGVTPLEVCDLRRCPEVSVRDRLWLLLREDLIPARQLRLLACDFAERALKRERKAGRPPDPRSSYVISVSRRFAERRATTEELVTAEFAAWAAVRDSLTDGVSWVAAGSAVLAARAAAWASDEDVTKAAAEAAEWAEHTRDDGEQRWQLKRVAKTLKGQLYPP